MRSQGELLPPSPSCRDWHADTENQANQSRNLLAETSMEVRAGVVYLNSNWWISGGSVCKSGR